MSRETGEGGTSDSHALRPEVPNDAATTGPQRHGAVEEPNPCAVAPTPHSILGFIRRATCNRTLPRPDCASSVLGVDSRLPQLRRNICKTCPCRVYAKTPVTPRPRRSDPRKHGQIIKRNARILFPKRHRCAARKSHRAHQDGISGARRVAVVAVNSAAIRRSNLDASWQGLKRTE